MQHYRLTFKLHTAAMIQQDIHAQTISKAEEWGRKIADSVSATYFSCVEIDENGEPVKETINIEGFYRAKIRNYHGIVVSYWTVLKWVGGAYYECGSKTPIPDDSPDIVYIDNAPIEFPDEITLTR